MGRGIVLALAAGWHVAINFRSNREAAATLDACGAPDLLVNNAGMAPCQRVDLLDMGEDRHDKVMDINLKGPAAAPANTAAVHACFRDLRDELVSLFLSITSA